MNRRAFLSLLVALPVLATQQVRKIKRQPSYTTDDLETTSPFGWYQLAPGQSLPPLVVMVDSNGVLWAQISTNTWRMWGNFADANNYSGATWVPYQAQ